MTGMVGGTDSRRRTARIVGVGTAVPPDSYSQADLLAEFAIKDEKIRLLFENSAIERRHLMLPPTGADGARETESQGQLLEKHRAGGLRIASAAIDSCLAEAGASIDDVRYLCCVSSTGLLTPGFSALVIKEMSLSRKCSRLDVVGMGCNAGLNALDAVANWACGHPGELALVVCIEVCSAAYVFDGTMRTAVVNSLFGDGAAAAAVVAGKPTDGPELVTFASQVIPEASAAMRFDWDMEHGRFSFFLDPHIPYVVGAHAEEVVGRLLAGTGLRQSDIAHWVVHSGGKKVIDSVRVNLGLTRHELRHTSSVLRDYGNLSSGSFLFSYQRLRSEGVARPGDYGVLMTMGPGSTIETALLRW
ncbi:3,5-dihydroxyphenylacetyl-CoA synthase DpgA [Verrucosispora sp. WMMD573]|uniref:3,5-dihydroxyphenylacetyl-CoA synthase DpgA n=1 Tax=Verrucosispora sp. WMMD573 TaxID=3015149 RepID=UPI00248B8907|nr:3,5-dihydroxyphenylacetyl-CoA synthase DpgA [Verrucosispora sp. WMMD573]WBB53715.1 type III polyketide synthase [Verrucosispora sp. WMMD573]